MPYRDRVPPGDFYTYKGPGIVQTHLPNIQRASTLNMGRHTVINYRRE